jgi:nucleoside-diphosphate-sugar epimerase
MKVLLVGGTGFLGGHVCRAFQQAGHAVTVISRGQRPLPPGVAHLRVDRRDTDALGGLLEGLRFDFTVDFTAFDAADVERLLLIPYAALGRYVMISSGQVYLVTDGGRTPSAEEDSDRPLIAEPEPGTPDHAEWAYGVGKRRAEGAVLALREMHGVRAIVLRLPIIQGEADGSLRLWAYLERMLDGGAILLPDGGTRQVRHVYAGDVAAAILRLSETPPPRFGVYNLAQPEIVTLREFLTRVALAAGCEIRFVEAAQEEIEAAGIDPAFSPYGGRWSSIPDPARAAGWGFAGSRLADYLPGTVKWHLENRRGHSHPGYAQRPKELAFASTRGAQKARSGT